MAQQLLLLTLKLQVPAGARKAVSEVLRRNKFMNTFWKVFTQLSRVYADLYNATDVSEWPESTQALRQCILSCSEKDITFTREQLESTDEAHGFVEAVSSMRRCGLIHIQNRLPKELAHQLQ